MSTDHWLQPDTLTSLWREVERSRLKYPGNAHMLAAIVESTGSLARALLCGEGAYRAADVGKEALKVAAIALRLAEEGDATFDGRKRKPVVGASEARAVLGASASMLTVRLAAEGDAMRNTALVAAHDGSDASVALRAIVAVPRACRSCGGAVEPARQCYAVPTCYACLAPPPPMAVILGCANLSCRKPCSPGPFYDECRGKVAR